MDNVNHPAHYNAPGRKECIVEMLEKFGSEKVQIFCELNAYKYRYRHEMKNGQEDLDKAAWYENKRNELMLSDRRWKIATYFGLKNQCNKLIEEMAELTQAICKIRGRKYKDTSDDEKIAFIDHQLEEMADVKLVLEQLIFLLDCEQDVQKIMNQKIERTIQRINKEGEQK